MAEGKFLQAEQQVIINVMHGRESTLNPEDMQSAKHGVILAAANEIRSEGVTPDLVTLVHKLSKGDKLDQAGGLGYLTDLYSHGLPTKDIEPYEKIVKEEKFLRGVRLHAMELLHNVEQREMSVDQIMAEVQQGPIRLGQPSAVGQTVELQSILYDELERITTKFRPGGETSGVPTPWTQLNKLTQGLQKGDLIIVAGRPSMGKSALAFQQALHAAKTTGPVFIASMEMSRSNLVDRALAHTARVEGDHIRMGYFSGNEKARLTNAVETMLDYHPILVNDTPRLTAPDIRIMALQAKVRCPNLCMVVVDYLGLIKGSEIRQRYLEVGEATKVMKQLARELNVPVVLVCQLNRSCEARDDKRPLLSDLRESGDIEQDADVVIMVFRESYYDETKPEVGELLIRKQRNGPVGIATVTWIKSLACFDNLVVGTEDEYGSD